MSESLARWRHLLGGLCGRGTYVRRWYLYAVIAQVFAGDDPRKSRTIRFLHRHHKGFRRWWGVL